MLLHKQRTEKKKSEFFPYSEHGAYMELGENVYVGLCIIRPKHHAIEACAWVGAYLQTFLTSALGKEDRHVLVSTTLFAEKSSPYPVLVIGNFHGHNLSSSTMALGSAQPRADLNKRQNIHPGTGHEEPEGE